MKLFTALQNVCATLARDVIEHGFRLYFVCDDFLQHIQCWHKKHLHSSNINTPVVMHTKFGILNFENALNSRDYELMYLMQSFSNLARSHISHINYANRTDSKASSSAIFVSSLQNLFIHNSFIYGGLKT